MSQAQVDLAAFDAIQQHVAALRGQLQRVIVGQHDAVEQLILAVLCEGHVMVVGVPGLAKTLLVRTLARCVSLRFGRIQFTPDLMPSDVVGTELIQEVDGRRELRFVPGPVFTQLLLADEINRTPPKTQAALLEAMAERQVTVAGRTLPLEQPFIVVATQNPIEQEGTYPLPEAQLDRFMFSLWMEYPTKAEEVEVVERTPALTEQHIEVVLEAEALRACQRAVVQMPASRHVVEYAVSLARATRPQDAQSPEVARKYLEWGAGPRAGQHLILAAKALAASQGAPTPSCDHVRRCAPAILRHRLVPNYDAAGENLSPAHILRQIMDAVPEPSYPQ